MKRNIPYKCTMKGCHGKYEQSKTNPEYYICNICGVGIWRDYEPPDISRANLIDAEGVQYRYGLNTRYTGGKVKNNKGSRSSKSGRKNKPKKRRIPEILQV